MFESVRQPGETAPAADIGEAVTRQCEMLTVAMYKAARRLAPLIDMRHALELLLIDEIERMRYCRCLCVLDAAGNRVAASIGREGVDHSQYARNRAGCAYMQNIIGVSDSRLSEVCFSTNSRRPSITAIQVTRDRTMQRVGFLGADVDPRELPSTGAIYSELQQWRQLRGDPGVFHGKLHFSSNRTTVRVTDDPFRYRQLDMDELVNPDTCLAWPRRPYPETARVPADSCSRCWSISGCCAWRTTTTTCAPVR